MSSRKNPAIRARKAISAALAFLGLLTLAVPPAVAKTAPELLREAPKPQFRQGHTPMPSTTWAS